jgi:hypothetical protein
MTTIFFLLLSFFLFGKSDLLADRYINAEKWILRTHSIQQMDEAYSDNVTVNNVSHITRDVGDFGPRLVAYEYDTALVLIARSFLGFDPVIVSTGWDKSTTKWIHTDILQVDFIFNITTGFNFNTLAYDIIQQGFRMKELIRFEPNSSKINLGYTIQDVAVIKAFAIASGSIPPEFACSKIIFPACNVTKVGGVGNYLDDTGFSTIAECVSFLNSLPGVNEQPCPYGTRSNTSVCRITHGVGAFLLPDVHCSHVKRDSEVCRETCLPACSNCHADAECEAIFPDIPDSFSPVYVCKCKNGYVGNGTSCTPKTCQHGNCPALFGSYDCSINGLCLCTETFTSQPSSFGNNQLCACPEGSRIVYNNSKPVCVPNGRCVQSQWECSNTQAYNQVKCSSYGNNTFTLFKVCLCNYGFTGGWEYPCQCNSLKRVVWSNVFNGEVCLSNSECTVNWHCNYPQNCVFSGGNSVGTCI